MIFGAIFCQDRKDTISIPLFGFIRTDIKKQGNLFLYQAFNGQYLENEGTNPGPNILMNAKFSSQTFEDVTKRTVSNLFQ